MFDLGTKMSPGTSWYEASVGERPSYPPLAGDISVDVAIVGGGFTGLSAAYHLASRGVNVALCEGAQLGSGASGRNGGQLGTGQRQWVEELEPIYGFERTKALFDLAEAAKAHLLQFASQHNIEMDYQPGQLSVVHKKRYMKSYKAHVEVMARYGYNDLHFMEAQETAARLGSTRYFAGLYDSGTGHIHPLKFLLGTARAAQAAGAQLYEHTFVTGIEHFRAKSGHRFCVRKMRKNKKLEHHAGKIRLHTKHGTVTAQKLLLATNGMGGALEKMSAARVLPIRSFIGATEPLDESLNILPQGEAVDDSRFVVRYFRKTPDNRLLFGGSEAYGRRGGSQEQAVRAQMLEVYPQLEGIKFSHIWGGTVGITVERLPFIRQVAPHCVFCGGYSGHGVMLSHYCGKLYADSLLGNFEPLRLMQELKISRFPGGLMRAPLLFLAMHWFSLLDHL